MSDSCCHEPLDVAALETRQRRVLSWVLVINAATFVMMIAGAAFSGSSSLLSGALDNLGDALTYALSLAVVGAGPTAKARVALFKGVLILGAALAVAAQIGWRVFHTQKHRLSKRWASRRFLIWQPTFCVWLYSIRTATVI